MRTVSISATIITHFAAPYVCKSRTWWASIVPFVNLANKELMQSAFESRLCTLDMFEKQHPWTSNRIAA